MTPQEMLDILSGRSVPSAEMALETLRKHPTCVLPAAMCLRAGAQQADAETRQKLTHAVALGSADRIAMADLADISGQDWASIYPQVQATSQKTTQDAINVFIETYGHSSAEEDALLEKLIFNPVAPDYFQDIDEPFDPKDPLALPPELALGGERSPHEKAAAAESGHDEPEVTQPPSQTAAENSAAESHEEPTLMESLAKIYIKQRKYGRAFEIINNLSLKYPEKSVYFADQLRFLRKLVNNQRRWDSSNASRQS